MDVLYTKALLEKQEDGYIAIASTDVEDRQGEVVTVDGWDIKNFKKNPVLLLFHDHHSLPVGKAEKIWIEKSGEKPKMMFKPVFEDITERGKAIVELVKQGFISAFSVGFRPLDSEGNTYTKQELLEISLVNVPANPEAMMLSYKSLKDAGIQTKTMQELGIPTALIEKMEAMETRLEKAEVDIEDVVKGLKYLNPQNNRSIQRNKLTERQLLTKTIDKAATMLLSGDLSEKKVDSYARVIKRTSELLIRANKEDLKNGTH